MNNKSLALEIHDFEEEKEAAYKQLFCGPTGSVRNAKILEDILGYHTSLPEVIEIVL